MIFERTKAYSWLYLFLCISFIPVVIWLFISVMSSKDKIDSLLLIMTCFCSVLVVLFLVLFIVNICKKKDAITINENKVILKTYKEQIIEFKDIKDIRKHKNFFNSNGIVAASILGILNSGYIEFTLNDDKKIYIQDIKNVSQVCSTLRELILKK